MGARLLSQISEPSRRLSEGLVERGELGRGRAKLLSFDNSQRRRARPRGACRTQWSGQAVRSPPLMAYLNENYLKLQGGYLFPEVARRVRDFCDANPEEAKRLTRCGIGDVTEPLPGAALDGM